MVGCVVEWQEHILLCRRAIEPRLGFWNLPGGYLENGETLEEGAVRETWEEAKAKVKIIRLHSVYNLPTVNQVFMHFLAELTHPSFEATSESSEVKLFHKNDVPWEGLAFHSNTFALQTYLNQQKDVHSPVFFGTLRK